jgi:hypothetical protein
VRKDDRQAQLHEIGDAVAWFGFARQPARSLPGKGAARYQGGCPKCGQRPYRCP